MLDVADRCGRHGLRYAGALASLADHDAAPAAHPEVVLAGHLHLRSQDVAGPVLQLCFAALVEEPFEVGCVDVRHDEATGRVTVEVWSESVRAVTVDDPPVLAPDHARFVWEPEEAMWAPAAAARGAPLSGRSSARPR